VWRLVEVMEEVEGREKGGAAACVLRYVYEDMEVFCEQYSVHAVYLPLQTL